jgi:hypothetical protein
MGIRFTILLVTASALAQQQSVAPKPAASVMVLHVSGDWRREGDTRQIARWDRIPEGSAVTCDASQQNNVLEYLASSAPKRLTCISGPGPRTRLTLAREQGVQRGFLSSVPALLLNRHISIPTPASVRAGSGPQDAAIPRDDTGRTDFSAVLRPLRAGDYRLRLYPFDDADDRIISETTIRWRPERQGSGAVSVASLEHGLYRVRIVTADDAEDEVGSWSAILVSSPHVTESAAAALQEAARSASTLSPEGRRNLTFAILAAYGQQR